MVVAGAVVARGEMVEDDVPDDVVGWVEGCPGSSEWMDSV
jgi:hypothetical protein